jgi:hypothetical protein
MGCLLVCGGYGSAVNLIDTTAPRRFLSRATNVVPSPYVLWVAIFQPHTSLGVTAVLPDGSFPGNFSEQFLEESFFPSVPPSCLLPLR